jgi:ribosome biogenesis GTPase A
MGGFWPVVVNVIKNSDIVLLVMDARMPEMSRNYELEEKIDRYRKTVFLVLNKCDLLSGDELRSLHKKYPRAYLVSGLKNLGFRKLKTSISIAGKRAGLDTIRVGVVGYPNLGKSAVINCLAKGARAKVSSVAGTTRGTQWIRVGSLRVIDSPGVIPFKEREATLGILTAKNPEKLDNPELVAIKLIKFLFKKYPERAEALFKIKKEELMSDIDVLEMIGRKRNYLLKGGVIDVNRTAMTILREWQKGKIRFNE